MNMKIGRLTVSQNQPPLVIAEIGINHGGDFGKAVQMVLDAARVGCKCVKFQYHIPSLEMSPAARLVVPPNADESIYDVINNALLTHKEHQNLKSLCESVGIEYLCTPFCVEAVDRLEELGVNAYKIGSGEVSNPYFIKHVASKGKPIILSTGMHSYKAVDAAVAILQEAGVPYVLMHCTSMYPTPHDKVRVGNVAVLRKRYEDAIIGFSDHSIGPFAAYTSLAFGARLIEKHFTSSKDWIGPDIDISLDPDELHELVHGTQVAYYTLIGKTETVLEEAKVAKFAQACVWTTMDIKVGDELTIENIAPQRPGTGEIPASMFEQLLGRRATKNIDAGEQLTWEGIK